jgi:hypothetical protein
MIISMRRITRSTRAETYAGGSVSDREIGPSAFLSSDDVFQSRHTKKLNRNRQGSGSHCHISE